jgi:hypothetical protein
MGDLNKLTFSESPEACWNDRGLRLNSPLVTDIMNTDDMLFALESVVI